METAHSFKLDNTEDSIGPSAPQIERMTRPFLVSYPKHDGKFYDRLKLADIYLQANENDGEDVRRLRDELTNIFVTRNLELLNIFIKKVLKMQ